MKLPTSLAGVAMLFAASAVHAQDVPQDPPVDVPEPVQTAPATPAEIPQDPEAIRAFSDEEINSFAVAAMAMRDLRADETLDEVARQARAEAIVAEAGLDVATYRAIGNAAQTDPAVAMRVQEAVNAMQGGTSPEDMMQGDEMHEEEPGT